MPPGPAAPPPVGGPGPGPVRWGLVAAVGVACTLAVSATGAVVAGPVRAVEMPAAATTTTATPPTTEPADERPRSSYEWDPQIAELAAFVEAERGLTYERAVRVELLAPDDYDDLYGEDSVGLYDGVGVAVRGTELDPRLRGTVVHELTHVLDDQHFHAAAPAYAESAEAQLAFSGLLEGDAMRVERAYDAMLVASGVPQADVMDGPMPGGVTHGLRGPDAPAGKRLAPSALGAAAHAGQTSRLDRSVGDEITSLSEALELAPYHVGEHLVHALLAEGGNEAVDAAFESPPVTTEQVLDPRAYLDGAGAVDVARPVPAAPAGEVRDLAPTGAINLYALLAAGIDPGQALDAATGWGGESAVTYEAADGSTCADYAVVGDSDEDTAEVAAAFEAFAASGVAATASVATGADGAAVLTACGLGEGASAHDPLDALTLPGLRGEALRIAIAERGYAARDAFGFGECVVDQVGYDAGRDFMTDVMAPPGAAAEFPQAFSSC